MELFRVGEAALDRLFSSLVETFADPLEPVPVDLLLAVFPYMPRDHLGVIATLRAFAAHRAVAALLRIGVVLAVALAIGGAVESQLPVGTEIDISLASYWNSRLWK